MSARLLRGKDLSLTSTTFIQDVIRSFSDNADVVFMEDISSGASYTYREVNERASGICRALQRHGLKAGDVVAVASPTTPEAIIFIIGVWLSGAASVSINPLIPIDEIRNLLKICKSKLLFAGNMFVGKFQEAVNGLMEPVTIVAPNGEEPVENLHDWIKPCELVSHVEQPLGPDHEIVVSFTSGTTGAGKGAVIRDQAFKFSSYLLSSVHMGNKILLSSPLFWISNPLLVTLALISGDSLILPNAANTEQLLQIITDCKPTFWFTGPSLLIEMAKIQDLDRFDTSSLQQVLVGGSTILPEQKKLIIQKLFNNRNIIRTIYSCTEVLMATLEMQEMPFDSPRFSTIGQTMDGVTLKVVDMESGELLGPNIPGEVCCKSPAVIKRYIERELTEKEVDSDGFWHMGDLAHYDDEGFFHFHSRIKELMKYKEYQIAPAELEVVIERHPEVIECAVVGRPSAECGELPTAFVVRRPGSSVTQQELYDFVAEKVIDQKKLRGGVYFMESLPKSAVGKILRPELVKFLQDNKS